MLSIQYRKLGIPYAAYWFAPKPESSHALSLVAYRSCRDVGERIGFVRQTSHTKIVDTNQPDDKLFAQFNKTTSYEIRRSQRDGVRSVLSNDLAAYEAFYNDFARQKNLPLVTVAQLQRFGDNTQIVTAVVDGLPVAMNIYLVDRSGGRARLLRSASSFRGHDSSEARNLIGRANRFAHWEAMKHFREMGFYLYDLGGYAPSTADEEIKRINQFKDGFGGALVLEADYVSWPLFAYQHLRGGGRRQSEARD